MRLLHVTLGALLLAGLTATAAPRHDLYLFGSIDSTGRVIGSRDAALNGVYRRVTENVYEHQGMNYPAMLSGAFDPRDARVFHVAAINGVLTTTDGGETWRVGTGWDITEPKSVAVDPNAPDTVYAALPNGVAVSSDRGRTWERRENGLAARGKYTQVVTVDRTQAGRVLAGCETGIYLTNDAGASWQHVFTTVDTVNDIQQSPHDPKLWLAVSQSAGTLRSNDGGLTWTKVDAVPSTHTFFNIAFDPTNAQRIAVGGWMLGLFTSEDGGVTWTERNAGLPESHRVWRTAVDPDTGRLYAAVDNEALYVSDDFGRTWQIGGMEKSRIQSFAFVARKK